MPLINIENAKVKKPHLQEELTEEQISEIIRCKDDPWHFINTYCKVLHPTDGVISLKLYDYQERLIELYHNNRFSINLLSRQMGKTACAAAYLLWYAMFVPASTILIAAHKRKGADEIMQRFRLAYEECPMFIKAGCTTYNKLSVEFDNHSRVVSQATTEDTGRGMSLSLVYLDEFAFVRPNIAREFWTSLRPTLASGGRCIITSTPNQDDDQFAQIWNQATDLITEEGTLKDEGEKGANGFKSYKVIWDQHPDRDEEWAAQEKSAIGIEDFRREHECEFVVADETLIDPLFLVNMDKGKDPIRTTKEGVRWYAEIEDDTKYLVALDPSAGTGGNPAAIQVLALPQIEQVAEWRDSKTPMEGQIRIMRKILDDIYDNGYDCDSYYSVENNGIGLAALGSIKEMGEDNIPGVLLSEPRRTRTRTRRQKGFGTTHASKLAACVKLKKWIENRDLKINSRLLVRELKNFIASGQSYEAKQGETDDLVSSMLLICRMAIIVAKQDDDIYDSLRDSFEDEEFREPMPMAYL